MGQLVHLHPPRTCVDCVFHALESEDGLLSSVCRRWQEPLDTETVAATCPDYEPQGKASP